MQDEIDDKNPLLTDDLPEATPIARWVPLAVVSTVVIGFAILTWYAYHAGVQSLKEDDLMVIEADKTPVKEKPADPGGMQFPDQDKTVFETFSGNAGPAKVERVVPSPEEPQPVQADTSGTSTWVSGKLHDSDKPGAPEQVIGEKKLQAPIAAPKHDDAQAVTTYSAKNAAASQPEKKAAPAAAEKAPEKSAKAEKPADKTFAKTVAKTGAYKVQLGAYRSEKEARDAWAGMLKKETGLTGHEPAIVKADLGDRGIYFRLRAEGFMSSAEAHAFCKKLATAGQGCLVPVD